MSATNGTRDPEPRADPANVDGTGFPARNLPSAVFRRRGSQEAISSGFAIGDAIVDLAAASDAGLIEGPSGAAEERTVRRCLVARATVRVDRTGETARPPTYHHAPEPVSPQRGGHLEWRQDRWQVSPTARRSSSSDREGSSAHVSPTT